MSSDYLGGLDVEIVNRDDVQICPRGDRGVDRNWFWPSGIVCYCQLAIQKIVEAYELRETPMEQLLDHFDHGRLSRFWHVEQAEIIE